MYIDKDSIYYPEELKVLKDAPDRLYYEGNIELLKNNKIAIVGSRECDEYSKLQAMKYSKYISENGYTVVSGLASGVDSIAHEGSYKSEFGTIAVLAGGYKTIYPMSNYQLYKDIIDNNGLVIWEHDESYRIKKYSFIKRNRIITAISRSVLIIAMKENSGTMHSAKYAIEQNKYLFAVPGEYNSSLYSGSNRFIEEHKAIITISPEDFIDIC